MIFLAFFSRKKLGIFWVLLALSVSNLRAADNDPAVASGASQQSNAASTDSLRAYLQLQEQLHDTQLTIERNRQEIQSAAVHDALTLSNRLQALEQSLLVQRSGELSEARRMNRLLLAVIGVFAAVVFGAAAFAVYFQSRAVSRLAEISTALSVSRGLPFPTAGALAAGEVDALPNRQVEQSSSRLLGVIQHLEKRITELEQTTALPLKDSPPSTNGGADAHPELALNSAPKDQPGHIAKLLERGQALLTGERPEDAIACFDEVLALEPNQAEALVKKGTALEKMRQPQEALEYYDRAIAADSTLTIAYLHKGGLCSRLEKYTEAMECYERALHTQEKKQAA
jgi:tetratricopeptide (TPR) repeat protein